MRRAYCFDLDGTITREELLPLIAREIDLFDEISALTEATIKGVIPFKKSFLLRCRLLQEVPASRIAEVVENIEVYDHIVKFIEKNRDDCYVITGNLDVWVRPMIEKLGCKFFSSHCELSDDRVSGEISVLDKAKAIGSIREKYDKIVSIGDGMGDVAMFEKSDLGIAYGATHYPIKSLIEVSDYVVFDERALCNLLTMQ